jgi:hypothetical protein
MRTRIMREQPENLQKRWARKRGQDERQDQAHLGWSSLSGAGRPKRAGAMLSLDLVFKS